MSLLSPAASPVSMNETAASTIRTQAKGVPPTIPVTPPGKWRILPSMSTAASTPFALPAGVDLTVRPLRATDAEAVVALARADEAESLAEPVTELVDVQRAWRLPTTDLDHRSLALLDGTRLVGYLVVGAHGRLDAVVAASHRGRGIGRALLDHAMVVARNQGDPEVSQTVPVGSPAHRFLDAAGGTATWDSWILELPADRRLPEQALPDGFTLGEGRPEEMHSVHLVKEAAFDEWPGRRPTSYEDWAADFLEGEEAAPWRCRVVRDREGRVVAMAMVIGSEDGMLWVDQLAVAAPHRGLGLGRALLADSFAEGRRRGLARAGLSTDSRTGALGLYEHVGMEVTATFRHLAIPV